MKLFVLAYLFFLSSTPHWLFQDMELQESMARGKNVYSEFCITCHLVNGAGVTNLFPPLANSDYLWEHREASIRGVKYGQNGAMTVNGVDYDNVMLDLDLTDEEVADVLNYVMNSWGNKADKVVTVEEVEAIEANY